MIYSELLFKVQVLTYICINNYSYACDMSKLHVYLWPFSNEYLGNMLFINISCKPTYI